MAEQNYDTSLQFQLKVIDYYCTFQYLMSYRTSDFIELNPHSYIPDTTVYCPFHENRDTKAAKLYSSRDTDNIAGEKLYCFAENKLYFPHSLLSPPKDFKNKTMFKAIVPYDPIWVFSAIWRHLSEEERKYWLSLNPDITINNNEQYNNIYNEYKRNDIDLFTVLKKINNL